MTAQIAEKLLIEGEEFALCTNPLDDYFELGGFNPRFQATMSALWRGYIGHWEITGQRLYLVRLRGTLDDGTKADLATVFPGYPRRVFAHWYSGTLRVPQGEQLEYVHMGYGSTHERDLLLDVERGVLMATRIQCHHQPEHDETSEAASEAGVDGASGGYAAGAFTVLPTPSRSGGKRE